MRSVASGGGMVWAGMRGASESAMTAPKPTTRLRPPRVTAPGPLVAFPSVESRSPWVRAKRDEIEACARDLERARAALTDSSTAATRAASTSRSSRTSGPVSFEIARLRHRGHRLADELAAIKGEWVA